MSKRVQFLLVGLACFLLGCLVTQNLFVYGQAGESRIKDFKWLYGMTVKSRKANEADFSDTTKKWGLEIYRDENNGNLVYVSETGSISVVPKK
jgi:hypothetical protein